MLKAASHRGQSSYISIPEMFYVASPKGYLNIKECGVALFVYHT